MNHVLKLLSLSVNLSKQKTQDIGKHTNPSLHVCIEIDRKCTTKVHTHDAYTVSLVLKLGLVVVVIVINTIKHQVFRSLYKPTTVTILS